MKETNMKTKYISNDTQVNLDESRQVWDNGLRGDKRVTLWADRDNAHVWAETNGDPVCGADDLRALLLAEGMAVAMVERVIVGDLAGL